MFILEWQVCGKRRNTEYKSKHPHSRTYNDNNLNNIVVHRFYLQSSTIKQIILVEVSQ